jgi:hypothetical protein
MSHTLPEVLFCLQGMIRPVTTYNSRAMRQQRSLWTAVLRDVHFWTPLIALLIGVLLLWIAR